MTDEATRFAVVALAKRLRRYLDRERPEWREDRADDIASWLSESVSVPVELSRAQARDLLASIDLAASISAAMAKGTTDDEAAALDLMAAAKYGAPLRVSDEAVHDAIVATKGGEVSMPQDMTTRWEAAGMDASDPVQIRAALIELARHGQ